MFLASPAMIYNRNSVAVVLALRYGITIGKFSTGQQ